MDTTAPVPSVPAVPSLSPVDFSAKVAMVNGILAKHRQGYPLTNDECFYVRLLTCVDGSKGLCAWVGRRHRYLCGRVHSDQCAPGLLCPDGMNCTNQSCDCVHVFDRCVGPKYNQPRVSDLEFHVQWPWVHPAPSVYAKFTH